MKTQWNEPQLKKLSLEETKAVEAIIMYKNGAPNTNALTMEPFIGWKCPCCYAVSGYNFTEEGAARTDFHDNHLPTCPKYDKTTERCIS